MKRYISASNENYKGVGSEENLVAMQNIAKKMMNSRGFDTSSWSFIKQFDGGYGKKGLHWNTPYGEASTILDMSEWNHQGLVDCKFTLFAQEKFNHPFFSLDGNATWKSIAEEFLK